MKCDHCRKPLDPEEAYTIRDSKGAFHRKCATLASAVKCKHYISPDTDCMICNPKSRIMQTHCGD